MRRKADLVHPFTRTPAQYIPGTFADARSEYGGDLESQAGTLLLRYLQAHGGRYRLTVIAGLLAERYPFHKQPLSFFQGVARSLVKEGKLALDGDLVQTPLAKISGDLQDRVVARWRRRHAP